MIWGATGLPFLTGRPEEVNRRPVLFLCFKKRWESFGMNGIDKKFVYTYPGTFVVGDCFDYITGADESFCDFAILDPPYEDSTTYWMIFNELRLKRAIPMVCFMYPDNWLVSESEQVVHWIKPVSTKNTSAHYSSFVEAIAVWHGDFFNNELHWSTRTGVFYDTLIEKQTHPHQKPESLIEKLIKLHCPPMIGMAERPRVFDPFAGSRVTKRVCDRLGYRSLSIDIKGW